jgi:MoaA/NifB/PqqE/SkfB family radical SAM enzyme
MVTRNTSQENCSNALKPFREKVHMLFHITDWCNLDCKHCFINASHFPVFEYSLDEISSLLTDMRALNVFHVTFSGGEPTIRKDFPLILEIANEKGFNPDFVSNGTLITLEMAKNIRNLVRLVLISLDGPEEYHDAFRGKRGAFKKTMEGINALRRAEVPFALQFTVTKESLSFVEWAAEIAFDLGAQSLKLEPLFAGGRAQNMSSSCLNEKEIDQLAELTTQLYGKYLATTSMYMGVYSKRVLTEHPCNAYACFGHTCHRGASKEPREVTILPDGGVAPVDSLLNPVFYIGNVREKPLCSVFQDYSTSPQRQQFLRLCERVFREQVVSYPYEAIPWAQILIEESWKVDNDQ